MELSLLPSDSQRQRVGLTSASHVGALSAGWSMSFQTWTMEHTYSVGPRSDTERTADAMSIGWQWKELATGLFGNSVLRSVWGVADIARVMGFPNGPKSV